MVLKIISHLLCIKEYMMMDVKYSTGEGILLHTTVLGIILALSNLLSSLCPIKTGLNLFLVQRHGFPHMVSLHLFPHFPTRHLQMGQFGVGGWYLSYLLTWPANWHSSLMSLWSLASPSWSIFWMWFWKVVTTIANSLTSFQEDYKNHRRNKVDLCCIAHHFSLLIGVKAFTSLVLLYYFSVFQLFCFTDLTSAIGHKPVNWS